MPGKSQRRRGKYSISGKKRKGRASPRAGLAQQSAIAQAGGPVALPERTVSAASRPVPLTQPTVVWYPHIASELRTIGILAGIMLVILIVLVLILA